MESTRENLILDLRNAASYELCGHRGLLDPRKLHALAHGPGLAQTLGPEYPYHPGLARGRRLVHGPGRAHI